MPYFDLVTNISRADIPDNFMGELATVLGETLGKDASLMMIRIIPDQLMYFGGVDEPCGQAFFRSIGKLGAEENIKHSKAITEKVGELGIISTRLFILFDDVPGYAVGIDGTTCKEKYGI